jgi:hypothetical protein
MTPSRLPVVLLAAAVLAGCADVSGPVLGAGTGEIAFDLRPLFVSAGGERCATVVESLTLTVEEEGGRRQTFSEDVTAENAVFTFPVEVEPGTVMFTATVRSNNGTVLYEGEETATVEEDGFQVEVPLNPVDAVLKACSEAVRLVYNDGVYEGRLAVINRGSHPLMWTAAFDALTCGNGPCFQLFVPDEPVAPGDTAFALATAAADTPVTTFDVQVASDVGTLDIPFFIDPALTDCRVTPDVVEVGEEVTVTATVTGTEPIEVLVDFGDGVTAGELPANHTYDEPDDYTIAITATNAFGPYTCTVPITVEPPPARTPSLSPVQPERRR